MTGQIQEGLRVAETQQGLGEQERGTVCLLEPGGQAHVDGREFFDYSMKVILSPRAQRPRKVEGIPTLFRNRMHGCFQHDWPWLLQVRSVSKYSGRAQEHGQQTELAEQEARMDPVIGFAVPHGVEIS